MKDSNFVHKIYEWLKIMPFVILLGYMLIVFASSWRSSDLLSVNDFYNYIVSLVSKINDNLLSFIDGNPLSVIFGLLSNFFNTLGLESNVWLSLLFVFVSWCIAIDLLHLLVDLLLFIPRYVMKCIERRC